VCERKRVWRDRRKWKKEGKRRKRDFIKTILQNYNITLGKGGERVWRIEGRRGRKQEGRKGGRRKEQGVKKFCCDIFFVIITYFIFYFIFYFFILILTFCCSTRTTSSRTNRDWIP
jgi:hypothetical protein